MLIFCAAALIRVRFQILFYIITFTQMTLPYLPSSRLFLESPPSDPLMDVLDILIPLMP
jgi:hypothetical protein